MRINHNIAALNTYSRLAQATTAQSKSLEKLSSGQRINKAGDDAAGLAISEKMRAQIRGLNQASRNSQDGISMIQTAEGALNESHSILQRMRELAVQSANDTNTTQDRGEIQKEVNQLSSEINRIAGTTEFNKQTLLDGGQAGGSVKGISPAITKAGVDSTQASFTYEFADYCSFATACTIFLGGSDILGGCALGCASVVGATKELAAFINTHCSNWTAEAVGGKLKITAVAGGTKDGEAGNCTSALVFCGTAKTNLCYHMEMTCGVTACQQQQTITFTQEGIKEGLVINVGACSLGLYDSNSGKYADANDAARKLGTDCILDIHCDDATFTICAKDLVTNLLTAATFTGAGSGVTMCQIGDNTLKFCTDIACLAESMATKVSVKQVGTDTGSGTGVTLQIGANTNQTFNVSFENMTGQGIGITSEAAGSSATACNGNVAYFTAGTASVENNGTTNQFALDVSSAEKATNAISVIDDAITKVSGERSKLGAYQNRLEHTISNLDASSENMTAAESRVRDVDMAKEMMEFTKNNILNQAATSMLSQANQQPQGVLKLLG